MPVMHVSARFPEELYNKIKERAQFTGCNVSDILRAAAANFVASPPGTPDSATLRSPMPLTITSINILRHEIEVLRQEHENMRTLVEEQALRLDRLQQSHDDMVARLSPVETAAPPKREKTPKEKRTPEEPVSRKTEDNIPLSEIVIPEPFLRTPPREEKVQEAIEYYKEHGKFDKPVFVKKKNMLLVDGFKRYVAAKNLGLNEVPVKFV
jgi:hypothetical protein